MKDEQKVKLNAVFVEVVKRAIGGDREHRWGLTDSFEVIDSVLAEDASIAAENGETLDKYSLSEEAGKLVLAVVNPSQFRQALEREGKLNAGKGKRQSRGVAELLKGV